MNNRFSIGDRVKISDKYHWAKNSTGEIVLPPDYIVEMSDGWRENFREIKSLKRVLIFYWIKFDEPQIDSDGDDLYQEAEIDAEYLETIIGK